MSKMITLRTDTKIEGKLTASTGKFGNEKSVISVTETDITFKTPVFGVSTERSFADLFKMLDDIDARTGSMRPSDDITEDYNKEGRRLPSFTIPDGDYTIALTDGFETYELENVSLTLSDDQLGVGYAFTDDIKLNAGTEDETTERAALIDKLNTTVSGVMATGTASDALLIVPVIYSFNPYRKLVYFKMAIARYDLSGPDYYTFDMGDYIYYYNPTTAELKIALGKVDLTKPLPEPRSDCIFASFAVSGQPFNVSNIGMFMKLEAVPTGYASGFHVSYAGMFKDRSTLTKIDLSQWSFANVTDMSEMFMGCYGLCTTDEKPSIDMRNANRSSDSINITDIFTGCIAGLKMYLLEEGVLFAALKGEWSSTLSGYNHPNKNYAVVDHGKRNKWLSKDGSSYILFGTTGSPTESDNVSSYGLLKYYGRYYGANSPSIYGHSIDRIDYSLEEVEPEGLPVCFKGKDCDSH